MSKPGLLCSFVVAVSAMAQTPDAAEQTRALAAVREYALNYTAKLPDFICIQVTQRTYYPNTNFRGRPRHDSFEEQVTFVDHKESYTVTRINGEPANNIGRDHLGGLRSTGEFGTLLGHTFQLSSGAEFLWERRATLKGRKMYVFSFRVPQATGYGLVESKRTLFVAYKGVLYADTETGAVWRVEMQCEIPRGSEYKELELVLDFKPTEVAGREFILPFHYQMHSHKEVVADAASDKLITPVGIVSETINEADYKAYRRFDADSSISFGNDANRKH
ncbi:MAG TPA: hypothetical protein VG096_22590 [Bryobacteraceae bacterium]|jgi:hypothetical protein|nr:hypothetical protein [Bryobacteraceae bacterium]